MKVIRPKGVLIPIGGAEDKENSKEILCRIIKETRKSKPRICVITLASSEPEEKRNTYRKAFRSLPHSEITFIHYDQHREADTEANMKLARTCDVVLFSGGDQLRLSSLLGGTELFRIIKSRYYDDRNFVVAGTSAGASAMSDTMVIAGSSESAMVKGELELTNGLDLISNVFLDTHFTERGRIGRLIETVTCNPGVLAIGMGENTAVVVRHGDELEVTGSGLVMIIDGSEIGYTDLNEKKDGELITVTNVKVHVLGPEQRFTISTRSLKEGNN